MMFTRGNMTCIDTISNMFTRYATCYGKHINHSKSIVYASSMSSQRHQRIANRMGFCIAHLLFLYLGAPIFKGRPKPIHFQHIANIINLKLANCKASILSIVERLMLVETFIQGMLMHTLLIYEWHVSPIKYI